MALRIRFHPPKWPIRWYQHDRIQVWHIPLHKPLSQVLWVWEAPALREYHPAARNAFLSLMRETQPEKLATLHSFGYRLKEEVHLDGLITGLQGLTENLSDALEVVYRLWVEVPLTEGALGPITERMAQERRRAWSYPSFRADAYLQKLLWGHTYALHSTLSSEAIQNLTAEEVRRLYQTLLRKSLRHLVVLAPTLPRPLYRWLGWQGDLSYRLSIETPGGEWHTEPDEKARQVSVRIAYTGLRRNHPEYPHYRLALMQLGGYFGSRLMQEIREKGGYTYGIYARPVEAWGGSYFTIESEIEKARSAEAIQKILDLVSAWTRMPFPNEETFWETRNYLIARLSPETPSEWAHTMANLLLHGYQPEWYLQSAEQLSTIETSDYERWGGDLFAKPAGGVLVGTSAPIFAV